MKKLLQTSLPVIAFMSAVMYASCYKDNREELYPGQTTCDTTSVTWTTDIQPVIQQNCSVSGCHDAATASGGVTLSTYAGVKTIADNGRLLAVTTSGSMPKNATKLDNCTLNKLTKWVNSGSPQN